jgi:LPXTG-motif cell wall-anchored protein
VKDYTNEQPISALLIAGGIGMALGMLIGRR